MLPQIISHEARSSVSFTARSTRATSAFDSVGPASFRFTVSPCLSVMVRLVRISFSTGTT